MRRNYSGSAWFTAVLPVVVLLVGCKGGTSPAPVAPTSAIEQKPPPPLEVTAVAEPSGTVLLARIARLGGAMNTIASWTGLKMPGDADAMDLVAGESISGVLDLDQPIDLIVAVDDKKRGMRPRAAISAAVRSLEIAKTAFGKFKLVQGDHGELRIEGLGRADADPDASADDLRSCALFASAGGAATRLVCANTDSALGSLAPFLTRTAPRTSAPSDLHLEIRTEPIRPYVAMGRQFLPALLQSMTKEKALEGAVFAEFARAIVSELVDFTLDVNKLEFDASLKDASASGDLLVHFRDTNSLLGRLATKRQEQMGPPPPEFFRLPRNADEAYFFSGFDLSDIEQARDKALEAAGHALEHDGLAAADRKALLDLAKDSSSVLVLPAVYGRGAEAGERAPRVWSMTRIQGPFAPVAALMTQGQAVLDRPGLVKWLKQEYPTGPWPHLKMVKGKKYADLPKEALPFEWTTTRTEAPPGPAQGGGKTSPKRGKTISKTLFGFVVPDAGSTWFVLAADEKLALEKARIVSSSADPSATLATREGLETLKGVRVSGALFTSARDLVREGPFAWAMRDGAKPPSEGTGFGTTPITVLFAARGPSATEKGGFRMSVQLPREALRELVGVVRHAHGP